MKEKHLENVKGRISLFMIEQLDKGNIEIEDMLFLTWFAMHIVQITVDYIFEHKKSA